MTQAVTIGLCGPALLAGRLLNEGTASGAGDVRLIVVTDNERIPGSFRLRSNQTLAARAGLANEAVGYVDLCLLALASQIWDREADHYPRRVK